MASLSAIEQDLARVPLYTPGDCARYLRLPAWLAWPPLGWPLPFPPLRERLSFVRLAEMFVLAGAARLSPDAEERRRLAVDACELLFDQRRSSIFDEDPHEAAMRRASRFQELRDHGKTLGKLFASRLGRIEFRDGLPARLFPFTREPEESSPRLVVLDPRIRFGRPTLAGTGLPTDVIHERHQAGDSLADLAEDYGTATELIEEAIRYEGAASISFLPWQEADE